MLKAILFSIIIWTSQSSLQAQDRLSWLMKQPAFKPILAEHLQQVKRSGFSTVSAVVFKPKADSTTIYLSSYVYLIEVKDHLPNSFTMVNDQPFLVYESSEPPRKDTTAWFQQVRTFIGNRLCDDLEYRELLKQPGPKVLTVPCSILYDGPIEKLIFVKDKLVKREVVSKVPY